MSSLNEIPLNPIWRQYFTDKNIKDWIEIFEVILSNEVDCNYVIEDWELKDAIIGAYSELDKLDLITEEQTKYLEDSKDEDILYKIFEEIYIKHISLIKHNKETCLDYSI